MFETCDFLQVIRIPNPKIQFSVNLKSFFSTYKFLPEKGWLFPVSTFKEKYFTEKIGSLAGFKEVYSISRKSTDFGQFWLQRSTFKVNFLNVQAKFRKKFCQFPWEGCWEHCAVF